MVVNTSTIKLQKRKILKYTDKWNQKSLHRVNPYQIINNNPISVVLNGMLSPSFQIQRRGKGLKKNKRSININNHFPNQLVYKITTRHNRAHRRNHGKRKSLTGVDLEASMKMQMMIKEMKKVVVGVRTRFIFSCHLKRRIMSSSLEPNGIRLGSNGGSRRHNLLIM